MPGVPFIALTATATRDTRVAIFDAMLMNEPCLIMESPNKENIAYIVEYMQKSTSLSSYFAWVADEIIAKKLLQLEPSSIIRQLNNVLLFIQP